MTGQIQSFQVAKTPPLFPRATKLHPMDFSLPVLQSSDCTLMKRLGQSWKPPVRYDDLTTRTLNFFKTIMMQSDVFNFNLTSSLTRSHTRSHLCPSAWSETFCCRALLCILPSLFTSINSGWTTVSNSCFLTDIFMPSSDPLHTSGQRIICEHLLCVFLHFTPLTRTIYVLYQCWFPYGTY